VGVREWISGLGKPRGAVGVAPPDPQITRWQKALSDFGFPYVLVSGAMVDEAFATAKEIGRRDGFVPLVVVPGHWNSTPCAPGSRCARARDLLRATVDGKQFLADLLRAMQEDHEADPEGPSQELFDELQPRVTVVATSGISIARRYVDASTERP
jgi:hypothetical protein